MNMFHNMLLAMSKSLGYEINELTIKKNAYSPIAHGEIEEEWKVVRKGLVEIFNGKPLPVNTPLPEELIQEGSEIRKGLIKLLNNKAITISVESAPSDKKSFE